MLLHGIRDAVGHGKKVDTRRELGSLRDTIFYLTVPYTQHISLNIDLERILRLP